MRTLLILAGCTLALTVLYFNLPSEQQTDSNDPEEQIDETPYLTWVETGIAAYKARDSAGLNEAREQLSKHPEIAAEAKLLRSMSLALEEQPEKALELLWQIAETPSTKPHALALAGELLFRMSDFQSAEGVLQAAIVADPSNPDPHRWLAAWYYDIGAMDNALAHLKSVADLDPTDARPWRMRGMILSDFERHNEAIEAYRSALAKQLAPHVRQEVQLELAASLLAARQPADALKELTDVPESAKQLSLQAECLLAVGKSDLAMKSLNKCLELAPQQPQALMAKAGIQRENGELAKARETLEIAVEHHPYEFDFRFHLMSVCNALNDSVAAEIHRKEMERLREVRTRFTELHHQSMQNPESAELRYALGQTAEELGKFQMAQSWYQAALALAPSHQQSTEALKALQQRQR